MFLKTLDLPYPIIQAPMGGAVSPAMTIAVSEAGGLGSVAGQPLDLYSTSSMASPSSSRSLLWWLLASR